MTVSDPARATYRDVHSGRASLHAEVAPRYQGMGLASKLIRYALDEARGHGRKVLPLCPFVRSYIEWHPDYSDLVAQPHGFNLAGLGRRSGFDIHRHPDAF